MTTNTPATYDIIAQAFAIAAAASEAHAAAEHALFGRLSEANSLHNVSSGERRHIACEAHLAIWGTIDGKRAIMSTVEASPLAGVVISGPCTYSHLADHNPTEGES